jgi:hypothetical protein
MSNGSPTAFLSWAILSSLVRDTLFSTHVVLHKLTILPTSFWRSSYTTSGATTGCNVSSGMRDDNLAHLGDL